MIPQPFNSSPLRITLPPHGIHRSRSLSHALLGIRFNNFTDFVAHCHLQRTRLGAIHLHEDLNRPELFPSDFMLASSPCCLLCSVLFSTLPSPSRPQQPFSFLITPCSSLLHPFSLLFVPPLLSLSLFSLLSFLLVCLVSLPLSLSLCPSLLCASFLHSSFSSFFFCEMASAWRQSVHKVRMQRLNNKRSRWRHD